MTVNITKEKKQTNIRASGTDEALRLSPQDSSPGTGHGFINQDELVEVTPASIRLRTKSPGEGGAMMRISALTKPVGEVRRYQPNKSADQVSCITRCHLSLPKFSDGLLQYEPLPANLNISLRLTTLSYCGSVFGGQVARSGSRPSPLLVKRCLKNGRKKDGQTYGPFYVLKPQKVEIFSRLISFWIWPVFVYLPPAITSGSHSGLRSSQSRGLGSVDLPPIPETSLPI